MELNRSSFTGLGAIVGGGLLLYYISRSISDWSFDSLGATFFPKVAAYGLIIFGSILFITAAWSKKREGKEASYTRKESLKILFFLVSLFLYVFLLPVVGFLTSTTLLMLAIFLILASHWRPIGVISALVFSFVSTYLLWVLFTKEFHVILP